MDDMVGEGVVPLQKAGCRDAGYGLRWATEGQGGRPPSTSQEVSTEARRREPLYVQGAGCWCTGVEQFQRVGMWMGIVRLIVRNVAGPV